MLIYGKELADDINSVQPFPAEISHLLASTPYP